MNNTVETARYFGIEIFGSTFDPWDYAAYAAGIFLAVLADTLFSPRLLSFWRVEQSPAVKTLAE